MKKLFALGLIGLTLSFQANARMIKGDTSWHRGKWSCEAYNHTGRTLFIKRVIFKGDKRRRGEGTFHRSLKVYLKPGESIKRGYNSTGQVDYVRSCFFDY